MIKIYVVDQKIENINVKEYVYLVKEYFNYCCLSNVMYF